MSSFVAAYLSMGIGIVVFFTIIIKFVATNKNSLGVKFRKKAEADGTVVTGYVKNVSTRYGNEDCAYGTPGYLGVAVVKYEYTIDGKTYYKKVKLYSDNSSIPSYPSTINIYYDINNPSKSYAENQTEGRESAVFWMYVAIILGIASILVSYYVMTRVL